MSWLARSLVNSLRGEEEDEEEDDQSDQNNSDEISNPQPTAEEAEENEEDTDPTRGVKEDLSQLTQTLTRQFWGVASFLAPPPSDPPQRSSDPTAADDPDTVSSPRLAGIRSDFAVIGGRFKNGISMLSSTKAVSEISKIASTLLPFGEEEEEDSEEGAVFEESYGGGGEGVGVTDEVVAFAMNVSMHPETWLDFPLVDDEDDFEEFDMSDAQQEHALAVECHAPRLAALRIELCPSHMSEGRFWKIYFVLLHSRLSRQDAELLTTPQIMQARAMLLQDLHSHTKPKSEESGELLVTVPSEEKVILPLTTPVEISSTQSLTIEEPSTFVPITDIETEKHPVQTTEVKTIDKSVTEEDPPVQIKSEDFDSDASNTVSIQKYEDEGDEWLEEDEGNDAGGARGTTIPLANDEDVSFSDLEEDDDDDEGKTTSHAGNSQPKDSKAGWVQLNKSSEGSNSDPKTKESSDWLSVDDLDEEL